MFMIPMMSVNRAKIFAIATVAVFGSVIGGVIAYSFLSTSMGFEEDENKNYEMERMKVY